MHSFEQRKGVVGFIFFKNCFAFYNKRLQKETRIEAGRPLRALEVILARNDSERDQSGEVVEHVKWSIL